jgi:signal transduction histidine kinase
VTQPTRLGVLVHELRSPVAALAAIAETLAAGRASLPVPEQRRLVGLAAAAGREIDRLLADPDLFSVRREDVPVSVLVAGIEGADVATPAGLAVHGDPVRLRQVLDNLVDNARRHAEHVSVRAAAAGDRVQITVADDGPGVAPGLDVFAPGTSGADSTGLGLYVARRIAEAHGGTLEVAPARGGGAAFTLDLPSASRARD